MKKLFLSTVILLASTATIAQAERVWSETDVDLATLLQYDFTVINAEFILSSATQSVEVIYLSKGNKLFRCTTFENQGQEPKHWCETVQ